MLHYYCTIIQLYFLILIEIIATFAIWNPEELNGCLAFFYSSKPPLQIANSKFPRL